MKKPENKTENALSKDLKENASANPVVKSAEEVKKESENKDSEDKTSSSAPKKITGKIRFLISPLQRFRLGYSAGDEVKVKDLGLKPEQIQELIDSDYAEKI